MLEVNDCIERQRRSVTEPRVGARNERLPWVNQPILPWTLKGFRLTEPWMRAQPHSGLVMIWNRQPRVAP